METVQAQILFSGSRTDKCDHIYQLSMPFMLLAEDIITSVTHVVTWLSIHQPHLTEINTRKMSMERMGMCPLRVLVSVFGFLCHQSLSDETVAANTTWHFALVLFCLSFALRFKEISQVIFNSESCQWTFWNDIPECSSPRTRGSTHDLISPCYVGVEFFSLTSSSVCLNS